MTMRWMQFTGESADGFVNMVGADAVWCLRAKCKTIAFLPLLASAIQIVLMNISTSVHEVTDGDLIHHEKVWICE